MHKYFCVDESGSFNTTYEQYYVISALIIEDNSILQDIHKIIEKQVRSSQSSTKELKAAHIKDDKKALFINEMLVDDRIKIMSLVIDKHQLHQKHDFIVSEFLIYNYAMKELVLAAYEYGLINKGDDLLCFVDARTMNSKLYNDLESYLNLEFFNDFKNIMVLYKDSSITREIQMADYVSNTIYGYYNKTNHAYEYLNDVRKIQVKIIPKDVR